MTLATRLLKDKQDHARRAAIERRNVDVLRARHSVADVADADPRAIAVGDDDVVIRFRFGELIVGRDGEALLRAVDAAFGRIGVGDAKHCAHVLERQAPRLQFCGIDLNADRRLLLSTDGHLGHTGDLRDPLRDHRIGKVVDDGQRQRIRVRCQDQDR